MILNALKLLCTLMYFEILVLLMVLTLKLLQTFIKPLLGEKLDKIALNGLAPFYAQHQAPPMVTLLTFFKYVMSQKRDTRSKGYPLFRFGTGREGG